MSILTYNGVQLPLPYTTNFRQEAVYEDSQTDWYCTRFTIQVQCVLNTNYLTVTVPSLGAGGSLTNPAQIMNVLRALLLKPRKTLSFMVGGVEMIPNLSDTPGTVDAQNGPRPQHCNISQLTNTTFLLEYLVIAHYWENSASNGTAAGTNPNPVLYNRWTETVEMDQFLLSKRIREGELRLRSDNKDGLLADTLRGNLATLSVPYHFLRESSKYTLTKDGLGLQYRIVDKEVFKMPPAPAYKAEGEFTAKVEGPYKQLMRLEAWCRVYGSRYTNQNDLILRAITVATGKIQDNLGKSLKGPAVVSAVGNKPVFNQLFTDYNLKVWLYDNIVEFWVSTICNMTPFRIKNVPSLGNSPLAYTPLSDGVDPATNNPIYSAYGTGNLFMRAASYWDPNLANQNPALVPGGSVTTTNPRVTNTPVGGTSPRELTPGAEPGTAGKTPEP